MTIHQLEQLAAADVTLAYERVIKHIVQTPCRRSQSLSDATGAEVYLKLENTQHSGSFKLRGVFNRLLSLTPREADAGLVAASTGNHGAAFAHAVNQLGLSGRLFLPRNAAASKLEAIKASGIAFELVGDDCVETEDHARIYARDHRCTWVSPYNDPWVVAGQGTIAVELLEQLDRLDTVLVPVGGGGLAGGISTFLKEASADIAVIGCQPANSPVMYESVKAGRIVEYDSSATLSDATAGGIEPGSITFDLCRRHVDSYVMVTESEIAAAIRHMHNHEDLVIEGGAALPVATVLKHPERFTGTTVVLVITGSKIDDAVLEEILA